MSESTENASRDVVSKGRVEAGIVYSKDPADFYYMSVNVPCQNACPAWTNVPAYIRKVYEGKYAESYAINRMVNILPGILGRICSRPCEDKCRHGDSDLGHPVNICHIKRSAADLKREEPSVPRSRFAQNGKKVFIIGAGPAGLAAAHDLATVGFDVTIYESLDKPGGMLQWGIPEFRLPRNVIADETSAILDLGVTLKTGIKVGKDVSLKDLLSQYDAGLVATGCYVSRGLDAPGEDLEGVYPGLEFLMEVNAGRRLPIGKRVIVIGAGFTAFDCARTALRLGAENVSICIRGLEEELRVTADEIHEAKVEGVTIRPLLLSQIIVGQSKVEGVEFVRSRPGDLKPDGRHRSLAIPGSEFVMPADAVIVAVGQESEPLFVNDTDTKNIALNPDPVSNTTGAPRLYSAGDFTTGPSTVIASIASGRRAAERIAEDLLGWPVREWVVSIQETQVTDRQREWDYIPRVEMPKVEPPSERLDPPQREVETGFDEKLAEEESKRCYLCYLHYEIDIDRCIYCRYCIDVAPRHCIKLVEKVITNEDGAVTNLVETGNWRKVNAVVIDNDQCIRCGACLRICPMDCISVSKVQLLDRMIPSGEQNA